MSRETYTLSDETRDAFEGHRAEIALAWGKDRSHVDGIMSGRVEDSFAKFKPEFLAVLNARGLEGIAPWADWFERAIGQFGKSDNACKQSVTEKLVAKLHHDAELIATFFAAIEDGAIDRRERLAIKKAVTKAREHLDEIEDLTNNMPQVEG